MAESGDRQRKEEKTTSFWQVLLKPMKGGEHGHIEVASKENRTRAPLEVKKNKRELLAHENQ